ncbi:MAG TPA: hypothetical protein QF804_09750 [Rhodospirillales bacterium]|nr:hypothetical protein [Rhodospirillales bacterium]HJO69946.1 hypothetical protein [Rhodospirillales bacterium]
MEQVRSESDARLAARVRRGLAWLWYELCDLMRNDNAPKSRADFNHHCGA